MILSDFFSSSDFQFLHFYSKPLQTVPSTPNIIGIDVNFMVSRIVLHQQKQKNTFSLPNLFLLPFLFYSIFFNSFFSFITFLFSHLSTFNHYLISFLSPMTCLILAFHYLIAISIFALKYFPVLFSNYFLHLHSKNYFRILLKQTSQLPFFAFCFRYFQMIFLWHLCPCYVWKD